MTTVALIGGDGAGKTTIAQHLASSETLKAKYMYMGISPQSADRLLPTSRLVLWLKRRAYHRQVARQTGTAPTTPRIPASDYEYSSRDRHSLWVTARLANRLAEAWYRHLISLIYQARGYLVIYDRHVLFDTGVLVAAPAPARSTPEKVYDWLMHTFFPRPDVTIFLETPGDVLYARKGEAAPEYLDREARMYLAQSSAVHTFVRIDSSQPLEEVKRQVTKIVVDSRS